MKLLLDVGDVYTSVIAPDRDALKLIRRVCRARPPGFQFSKKYKAKQWDGYISLVEGNRFPTGLLRAATNVLKESGYELAYNNLPRFTKTAVDPHILPGIKLWDHQLEACEKLLYAGRGIAKMATNSGKTEVFAALLKHYDAQALVLQSEITLAYQTRDRLQKYMPDHHIGIVGDGQRDFSKITVCTIQTLKNLIDEDDMRFAANKVVVLDECHHGSSDTYLQTLQKLPGWHRFGFSGTPLVRNELMDMRLIAMTGEVLVDISNSYLIEGGFSAKPTIHMHVIEYADEAMWKASYASAYDAMVVNNLQRNELVRDLAVSATGVTLIFVSRIRHGKMLHKMIDGSVFISGKESSDVRNQVLQDMRERKGKVYIATNIFDEGLDVPSIDTLIYAVGGKSQRQVLQRIGRGLRKESQTLTVHDFIDDTNRHLLEHSDQRIVIYEQEGFDLTLDDATTIVTLS